MGYTGCSYTKKWTIFSIRAVGIDLRFLIQPVTVCTAKWYSLASELTERPSLYKATIGDLNSVEYLLVEYLLAFIIKKPILDYLGLCPRNKAIRIFSIRAKFFYRLTKINLI